jgi:hypothetical protein
VVRSSQAFIDALFTEGVTADKWVIPYGFNVSAPPPQPVAKKRYDVYWGVCDPYCDFNPATIALYPDSDGVCNLPLQTPFPVTLTPQPPPPAPIGR